MADKNEVDDVEEGDDVKAPKEKKHNEGSADLEKVTDFAEEKELKAENLTSAMSMLQDAQKEQKALEAERARSLAAVVIQKADVDLLVSELDISAEIAERTLRECRGDVVATMRKLVH